MTDGYQVVEPQGLLPLYGQRRNFAFAVAAFEWLIGAVRKDLGDRLLGVSLRVIRVEYLGAYPALGIHYDEGVPDVQVLVEEACERALRTRPVSEFVEFLGTGDRDWTRLAEQLMSKP